MHSIWQSIYAGKWYFTHARPLRQARLEAKQRCWQINQLTSDNEERTHLLKQLCPHLKALEVGRDFYCDYGFNIIGEGKLTLANKVVILDAGRVQFGDNVMVGNETVICALHHPKDAEKRAQGLQRAEPVIIGPNVILGDKVSILPGARIPANTVIPANSVVTRTTFTEDKSD